MNQLALTYPGYDSATQNNANTWAHGSAPSDSYEHSLRQQALEYPHPGAGSSDREVVQYTPPRSWFDYAADYLGRQAASLAGDYRFPQPLPGPHPGPYGERLPRVNVTLPTVEEMGRKNLRATPAKKAPIRRAAPQQPKTLTQGTATKVQTFGRIPTVSAPVNISKRINVASKPKITAGAKGIVVVHREMIGQIIPSGTTLAYQSEGFVINPGKYGTFPWLSNIAANFDKYIFRKLRFSTISNQSTSIAGRVGLGFDVDSTDPLPADRNEFFSLTYHTECAPWDSVALDVPVDGKERFINSHTVTDSKLIDVGQLIMMSDSIVATSGSLSDVVVEYIVELIDPQQAVYSTQLYTAANFSGTTLDTMPTYGPSIAAAQGPGSLGYASTSTVQYLTLQQGYYMIHWYTADTASGTPTVALAVNGGTGRMAGLGNTDEYMRSAIVKITVNFGQLRVTYGTVTPANTEEILGLITRISAAVYTKISATGYSAALTTF